MEATISVRDVGRRGAMVVYIVNLFSVVRYDLLVQKRESECQCVEIWRNEVILMTLPLTGSELNTNTHYHTSFHP